MTARSRGKRNTVPVLLRLPPEVDARLRALASERGITLSRTVEGLLDEAWTVLGSRPADNHR